MYLKSHLLMLSSFLPRTQVYAHTYAGTSDSLPLRSDLQYSHISVVSPLYPLFSLSLFAGSLALSGVIGARGYRRSGARALQLLCRSLGYRYAKGQSPTDRLGLKRKQEETSLVIKKRKKRKTRVNIPPFKLTQCFISIPLSSHRCDWSVHTHNYALRSV